MNKPKRLSKTYSLTFRHEAIVRTMRAMVGRRIVRASSWSERLEQLMAMDIRRHAVQLRKAGIPVPDFVRDKPADIIGAIRGEPFENFFQDGKPRGYTPDGHYTEQ